MDETFPDLGSLTDVELKDVIRQLTEEETEISYRRRILHGKIDILRAELVNRLRNKHDGGDIDDHAVTTCQSSPTSSPIASPRARSEESLVPGAAAIETRRSAAPRRT